MKIEPFPVFVRIKAGFHKADNTGAVRKYRFLISPSQLLVRKPYCGIRTTILVLERFVI